MSHLTYQLASRHASWQEDRQLARTLARVRKVIPGEPILFDNLPLKIETFPLCHSIPETMGIVVQGEKGRWVHLGDFKFKGMDPVAEAETINRFYQIARKPVDFLSLNIINAHVKGFAPIEALVIDSLSDIMVKAEGRVIITCFSTNLERIRQLNKIAQFLGRPVQFLGAGMQNSQELLGIKSRDGDQGKAVIFVTGCQAEEESVLWRVAKGESSPLGLRPDDTLIFSARCIPGSEEPLKELFIALCPKVGRLIIDKGEVGRLGLKGLGIEESLTHVSGHEFGEGIRLALEIFRPRKGVFAWPQTSPQIEAFRQIAEPLGVEILPESERVIEI